MRLRHMKTDAMVAIFKARADKAGVFNFDAEAVGIELGITKRAVEDIVSGLIGLKVIDRHYWRENKRLCWDYRFTGKEYDRRTNIPRDKKPPVTPAAITASLFGDPPAGRSVLDQIRMKAKAGVLQPA